MKRDFWPELLYLAPEAKDTPLAKRIISRIGNVEIIELEDNKDPLSLKDEKSAVEKFNQGKRALMLTKYEGNWLKACPGTQDHVCCNLWIVNPGEGCPMDCTYCYLQSYLKRNPTLKLYTNTGDMLEAIREKAESNPNRLFRIGTGELIDSLVWDELSDLSLELVPFFGQIPNIVLELKSKFNYVQNLLEMKDSHNASTVVSWSVNAKSITEKDEAMTASLEERIEAAEKVIEAGYRVGFHFDPVVEFPGWEDEYSEAVNKVFKNISAKDVAWVSVSTLRYKKEMKQMMLERFPNSKLALGENFLASDNKLRYFQPLRLKLTNFVWKKLKEVSSDMPVYMCMESSAAWKAVNGASPVAGSELKEVFSRKASLNIVESGGQL